jgi:hypothetical protein
MIGARLTRCPRARVLVRGEPWTGVHRISGHGFASMSTFADFDGLRDTLPIG